MPPKPSNNKKRSGKKKNSSTRRREERKKPVLDDDGEEKLAHEFLTSTSLGRSMAQSEAYRLVAATACAVPNPDVPPCDNCSKPFSGTMQCSRCESVFYCDRDCQVAHWTASHKLQCAEIKQQNDETAKHVIANFATNVQDWKALDVAGAYKAAVHHGLHDKIREVMQVDTATIVRRGQITAEEFFLYTPYVMEVLFRGQRAEGKTDDSYFNCYDGVRIRGYVKSHPHALEAWLLVSFQLALFISDRDTLRRMPDLYCKAQDSAHDIWSGWTLVFASPTASRAVLLVPGRGDDHAAATEGESAASVEQRHKRFQEAHVRRIAISLRKAYHLLWDVQLSMSRHVVDLNDVSCNIGMVAAMVHLRSQEYKIAVNVEQILNFKGVVNQVFQELLIPMAKRTIEKGHLLNPQEANAVMAKVSPRMGLD